MLSIHLSSFCSIRLEEQGKVVFKRSACKTGAGIPLECSVKLTDNQLSMYIAEVILVALQLPVLSWGTIPW